MGKDLQPHPRPTCLPSLKNHGGRLVIINRESTPLDAIADDIVHESIGSTLTAIDRCYATAISDSGS